MGEAMKGDFSRIAHDPRKQYSRVLKQQGRVDLDADHNEGADIHHHLDRVTRVDVIGASGVPSKGGAFKLDPTPENDDLFITEGRFYLDGLVVEVASTPLPVEAVQNEANAVRVPQWRVDGQDWDTDQWVELTAAGVTTERMRVTAVDKADRKVTLTKTAAPFLNATGGATLRRVPTLRTQADAPDATGTKLTSGQALLLYLEVFERHVTEIEDPALREVALGGPDTTTRVKTVWRLLGVPAGNAEDCASPVANWPPTAGKARLTTTATATPKSDDPCVLPPEGGYRGIENRLYRVEVHKAGGVGGGASAATYKWSRDNGAVAYAIQGFQDPEGTPAQVKGVKLKALGRDRTLGLREGDWVEVTDDQDELSGASGVLGQVEDVDLAERTVRLNVDLTTYATRDRHPKLRRWDMTGPAVTAQGIRIDGTTDELEDGVTIDFTGTDLRAGDWWAFAARTATADVERLHARPPFNDPRRYAKIALVTWEMDPATMQTKPHIHDCRKPFDPLTEPCGCCCDVTVGDGVHSFGDYTDLQKAIDSIHAKGRVCILKGTHKVKKTITVSGAQSLHVRACGSDARIVGPSNQPTFSFANSAGVLLENLHVHADADAPLVRVTDSGDVTLRSCHLINVPAGQGAASRAPAATLRGVRDVSVEDCTLRGFPALVLEASGARVARNALKGGGLALLERSDDVLVEENLIGGGKGNGVTLGAHAGGQKGQERQQVMNGVALRSNRIVGMEGNGISSRDPLDEQDDPPLLAGLVVEGNEVRECVKNPPAPANKPAEAHGGIVVRGLMGGLIHANRVVGNAHKTARAVGILAHGADVVVTDNLVEHNGMKPPASAAGGSKQIAFEDMPPDTRDGNTRVVDDVRFEVFDYQHQPSTHTRIWDTGQGRGLDCFGRTLITFPEPVNGVELKIGAFHSGGRVTVTSQDGATATEEFDINDDAPQHVAFDMPNVVKVEVQSQKNSILMMLETGDAPLPPQPFQGGIFVLGRTAVYRKRTKENPWAADPKDMEDPGKDTRGSNELQPWSGKNSPQRLEQNKGGKVIIPLPSDIGPEGQPGWKPTDDVVVHDNVVNAPAGLALAVVTRAPVSVQDNRLRSHGVALHGEPLLDQAACVIVNSGDERLYMPPYTQEVAVMKYNAMYAEQPAPSETSYGEPPTAQPMYAEQPYSGQPTTSDPGYSQPVYSQPAPNEQPPPPAPSEARDEPAVSESRNDAWATPDRRVLVEGNQVAFVARDAPRTLPAAHLASPTDDLLVSSNQFRTDYGDQQLAWAVQAEGKTLQVRGNRFYEKPLLADFSLRARGGWGYVILNVAMHCIMAQQPLRADENIVQTRTQSQCEETTRKYG